MHYAPKILKHYLDHLMAKAHAKVDPDVHTELEMMTKAFDELFGRAHTHEPESKPDWLVVQATKDMRKVAEITEILADVPVPVGGTVDGVRWLAKKYMHPASAAKKINDIEDLLCGPYYNSAFDLVARIKELLASETLAKTRGTVIARGHTVLSNAGVPDETSYLVDRIRILIERHNAEQDEIHKALNDAWACPAPLSLAALRVRALVRKYHRLRDRSERPHGVASDIKHRETECINKLLDDIGVAPNDSLVVRVRSLVELFTNVRDLERAATGHVARVHSVLNGHGVLGNPDLAKRVEAALPDYEALAQATMDLDTEVAIHGASQAIRRAADIVRNWRHK